MSWLGMFGGVFSFDKLTQRLFDWAVVVGWCAQLTCTPSGHQAVLWPLDQDSESPALVDGGDEGRGDPLVPPDGDAACPLPCDLPHAEAVCVNGECQVAECHDDWLNCDVDPANGCEVPTTMVGSVIDDTYVVSVAPELNMGGRMDVSVTSGYSSFFRFDVTFVPDTVIVVQAAFAFRILSSGPMTKPVALHEMGSDNSSWREGQGDWEPAGFGESSWDYLDQGNEISWAGSAGARTGDIDFVAQTMDTRVPPFSTGQWISWSGSATMVERWRDSISANAGVTLRTMDGFHLILASKENPGGDWGPQMTVTVACRP